MRLGGKSAVIYLIVGRRGRDLEWVFFDRFGHSLTVQTVCETLVTSPCNGAREPARGVGRG